MRTAAAVVRSIGSRGWPLPRAVVAAALLIASCAGCSSKSGVAAPTASRVIDTGAGVRVFFVHDGSDAALFELAKACAAHHRGVDGVTCFGYRSSDDLAADAPDAAGNVQHTCFRVRYARTPDGSESGDDHAVDIHGGGCPSDNQQPSASAEAAQAKLGEPIPAAFEPFVVPTNATLDRTLQIEEMATYFMPSGVTEDELLSWLNRYMPAAAPLGDATWDASYAAKDRSWCRSGLLIGYTWGHNDNRAGDPDPGRAFVIFTDGSLHHEPC